MHGRLSTECYPDVTPGTEWICHLMSLPLPLASKIPYKENLSLLQEATNMPDIQSRPVKIAHSSCTIWPLLTTQRHHLLLALFLSLQCHHLDLCLDVLPFQSVLYYKTLDPKLLMPHAFLPSCLTTLAFSLPLHLQYHQSLCDPPCLHDVKFPSASCLLYHTFCLMSS